MGHPVEKSIWGLNRSEFYQKHRIGLGCVRLIMHGVGPEDMVLEPEDMVLEPEDMVSEPEDMVSEPEDLVLDF